MLSSFEVLIDPSCESLSLSSDPSLIFLDTLGNKILLLCVSVFLTHLGKEVLERGISSFIKLKKDCLLS